MFLWSLINNLFYTILQSIFYFATKINSTHPQFALYFLFILSFWILIYFCYIKLKYPFWFIQPVCHTYSLFPTRKIAIIKEDPIRTKFTKPNLVQTDVWNNVDETKQNKIIDFLQCYFIDTEDNFLFQLPINSLNSYCEKCIFDALVSIICNNDAGNIVGVSFAKPVLFFYCDLFDNNICKEKIVFHWDFFATHRTIATLQNARELFQTHEYNQRQLYPKFKISCFRKEVELCGGVVPFSVFQTHYYYLQNLQTISTTTEQENTTYTFQKLTKKHKEPLNHILYNVAKNIFPFCVLPTFDNLLEMMKSNYLLIFGVFLGDELVSLYFFKNNYTNYEFYGNSVQCISAISVDGSQNNFLFGFEKCCEYLFHSSFGLLLVDDNSHLAKIIPEIKLQKKTSIICGFYFYNLEIPTVVSSSVLILV